MIHLLVHLLLGNKSEQIVDERKSSQAYEIASSIHW